MPLKKCLEIKKFIFDKIVFRLRCFNFNQTFLADFEPFLEKYKNNLARKGSK
jgi:hypothetical protein